jgi:hypothetical protein
MDMYTNSATRYSNNLTLFFPSVYFHFDGAGNHPFNLSCCSGVGGSTNDGLWDTRFAVSRDDGATIRYPDADVDARAPWLYQGNNRCEFTGSVDDQGGWCNPFDGSSADTDWDTSMVGSYPGLIPSADGELLYIYKWGTAATHHVGGHCPVTWGNKSGVGLMALRTDGFVSVDAGYFHKPLALMPQFTTVPLVVPLCSSGSIAVKVNVMTSVVGLVLVELRHSESQEVIVGFGLDDADQVKGSFISKPISWSHGKCAAVPLKAIGAAKVIVHVVMVDASLFSVQFACAGTPG